MVDLGILRPVRIEVPRTEELGAARENDRSILWVSPGSYGIGWSGDVLESDEQ